jgi:hypothetical protein
MNRKQSKLVKRCKAVKKAANIKRSKAVPAKVKRRNEKKARAIVGKEVATMLNEEIQKQRDAFNTETVDAEVVSEQNPA